MKNIMEIKHGDKTFTLAWNFAFINDKNYDILLSSISGEESKMASKFPSRSRVIEFVTGRHCVRQAIASYEQKTGHHDINIGIGVWGYPFIQGSDLNISIAHTDKCVIAICTNGAFPAGIDMEEHKPSNDALILSQLNDAEKKLLSTFPGHSEGLHILWAAKEAVAKALRTGFRVAMPFFEVSGVSKKQDGWHIYFDTIGVLSVIAVNTGSGVLALALPTGSSVINGFEIFSAVTNIHSPQKQNL